MFVTATDTMWNYVIDKGGQSSSSRISAIVACGPGHNLFSAKAMESGVGTIFEIVILHLQFDGKTPLPVDQQEDAGMLAWRVI